MVEEKPLTPAKINQLRFAARNGKADPADVRRALNLFYRLRVANRPILSELLDFVTESFGRYLGHKDFFGPAERSANSLDAAFGLLKRRGRPEADEHRLIAMAATVLRLRLKGVTHQDALDRAAKECRSNSDTIGEAWKKHLPMAIMVVQLERGRNPRWTDGEKRILEKIKRDRKARTQRKSPN